MKKHNYDSIYTKSYLVVGEGVAVAEANAARNLHVEHVGQLVPRVVVVHQGVSSVANLIYSY